MPRGPPPVKYYPESCAGLGILTALAALRGREVALLTPRGLRGASHASERRQDRRHFDEKALFFMFLSVSHGMPAAVNQNALVVES